MFSTEVAWWCNGKEIAHGDGPGVVDIRLTRPVIRTMRERLRDDARVVFRKSASDWIMVRYAARDLPFVIELVERAVAEHRPPRGQRSKPPPTGHDLDRRRQFH